MDVSPAPSVSPWKMVHSWLSLTSWKRTVTPGTGSPPRSARTAKRTVRAYRAVTFTTRQPPFSRSGSSARTSIDREAAEVNHPRSGASSGSQAPMYRHLVPSQNSTQAWLSSQWAQRGA